MGSKKYTYEEVKKFVEENSDCKLLSTEYKDSKEKLKFQCSCGVEVFETTFNKFKSRNKILCNKCSIKKRANSSRLSFEDVKSYIENNSDCKLLSNSYINNSKKLLLECGCKKKFEVSFSNFKRQNKKQCNSCSMKRIGKLPLLDYEYVKNFINSTGSVLLSTEYKNIYQKLLIKCKNCEKEYYKNFDYFRNSKHKVCPECTNEIISKKQSFNYEDVKNFIESKDCILISKEYINMHHKLKILCSKCKKEVYEVSFSAFKNKEKHHCNKCSKAFIKSKGEEKIEKFLNNNNIRFKPQKRFDDCKDIRTLPFDFYLIDKNTAIEYDGEGHVREIYFTKDSKKYAKSDLEKTKKHDQIKTKYCKENNINLLRISYTKFNEIEQILENYLNLKRDTKNKIKNKGMIYNG